MLYIALQGMDYPYKTIKNIIRPSKALNAFNGLAWPLKALSSPFMAHKPIGSWIPSSKHTKAVLVKDNRFVSLGIFTNDLIRFLPITSAVCPQDVFELVE